MKSIEETHPSLKGEQGYVLRNSVFVKEKSDAQYETVFIPYHIQKHTIDKAVLKETLERKRETIFRGTEASDDLNSQTIEEIWKLLKEEE